MSKGKESGRDYSVEVAISGGGLVGLTLAISLAQAGISVLVVDAEDPEVALAEPFDGRSSAIAACSHRLLEATGVWERLEAAAPILDIRVTDGQVGRGASRFFLHYDSEELGEGPLGYIVENRLMRRALHARAAELDNLLLLAPMKATGSQRSGQGAVLKLESGEEVSASLIVAAEGRRSPLREEAGIAVRRWDYRQSGIVCTISHELPHYDVAFEHFLPSGPFAVLPLSDDESLPDGEWGRYRSSIVWTERPDLVPHMMELDDAGFSQEIQRRFGDSLGRIKVLGRRWSYPLSLQHADSYHDERLILVGDAAHGIHPISGQGFNLGIKDVAALAECLVDARRLGQDLGNQAIVDRYARWRRFDNMAMIAATDGLNRLFSNNLPPVRLARDLGMAAVNQLPPLRRFFMRHAMGTVGDLPKLFRGEAL
ncbi:UbiH/UbiF/VisC/COQ6 family ubiquinone biosynthesis hydroxylase [Rhodovibrionaceae bacterium A322]